MLTRTQIAEGHAALVKLDALVTAARYAVQNILVDGSDNYELRRSDETITRLLLSLPEEKSYISTFRDEIQNERETQQRVAAMKSASE